MLNKAKELKGYTLHGNDGEIGKVNEFYFDDRHWAIRYLVADTGGWLSDRQVLISPHALRFVNKEKRHIVVDLTKQQIGGSPSLSSDKPVSRQFEEAYYAYYGWPMYWSGTQMAGNYPQIVRSGAQPEKPIQEEETWNPDLRSTHDVSGHHVQAEDGVIGHVDDFVIDDEAWAIRYLIIDTRNWWPGKKVLVSPRWIERVSWDERKVFVNVLRETIKQAPEYTEESLLTRDYETRLHGHYNRQGYWVDAPAHRKRSN
jgi:hypothetical protein